MRIAAAVALASVLIAFVALSLVKSDADGTESALAAWLFAGAAIFDLTAGFLAYFAPLWIALLRRHPDTPWIATLTLLGGWTVIGWLLAMVWAVSRLPVKRAALPYPGFQP